MRDNAKGGALTEVTFYILLSLYTPKHGYAVMQFIEEKTDGIITYATPFTVFRVKSGKLSAIQKIQPTPIKSQAPQPNTVSVHTASQTVKNIRTVFICKGRKITAT